jgi:DNA primase
MRTLINDTKQISYNVQSLRNALRELEVDFHEGPTNFIMRCFWCEGSKQSLYIHHTKIKRAGVYHCFRCGRHGHFDQFIAGITEWGPLQVLSFCRRHRSCPIDPDDTPDHPMRKPVTEEYLDQFNYRHAYVYDRGLTEPTLRRYRIGYDPEQNDIIIPWFDRVGNLMAIKRRAVLNKYYRYETDKNITACLFGLHLVRPQSIVWITEGEFDAMWLDQCFRQMHKQQHAAIALGGKFLHESAQRELAVKNPTMTVLATDNDDDGREAAEDISAKLHDAVLMVYPGDIKDPNAMSFVQVVSATAHIEAAHAQREQRKKERYNAWLENHQQIP